MSEQGKSTATLPRLLAPLVVLALAFAGFAALKATRPDIEPTQPLERSWPVAAVPAEPAAIRAELPAFGQIIAGRQVELRPLVEGVVSETAPHFVEGGLVEAGDWLVALDPFEYRIRVTEHEARRDEAEARLEEIRTDLAHLGRLLPQDRQQVEILVRDLARREDLAQRGATSEKALDDARFALSQARQRLVLRQREIAQAESRVRQLEAGLEREKALLEQARRDLEQTRLLSPFAGFLTDVSIELGKRISRADRVARVIDANRLEVRFHLSDSQFGRLLSTGGWQDRPVRILWRAGDSTLTFEARIERLQGEVVAARGGVILFARLQSPGLETPLRPGAFVEVAVDEGLHENVVRIPESALHGGREVFVVREDRLVALRVTVAGRVGADTLVRGPFVPGEPIVVTRFPEIAGGLKVDLR